jgi:hypothetical protein
MARLGEVRERGLPLPIHSTGVRKQRQSQRSKADVSKVTQANGEERDAVVRAPQSR